MQEKVRKDSVPWCRKSQSRPEVPTEVLIIFPPRLQEVCHCRNRYCYKNGILGVALKLKYNFDH